MAVGGQRSGEAQRREVILALPREDLVVARVVQEALVDGGDAQRLEAANQRSAVVPARGSVDGELAVGIRAWSQVAQLPAVHRAEGAAERRARVEARAELLVSELIALADLTVAIAHQGRVVSEPEIAGVDGLVIEDAGHEADLAAASARDVEAHVVALLHDLRPARSAFHADGDEPVDLPPVGLEAIALMGDGRGHAELHADVRAAADDREACPLVVVGRVLYLHGLPRIVGACLAGEQPEGQRVCRES